MEWAKKLLVATGQFSEGAGKNWRSFQNWVQMNDLWTFVVAEAMVSASLKNGSCLEPP